MSAFARPVYALRRFTGRLQVKFSDEQLAFGAVAGSREDFELLVRRYSASLYRVVYRMCGSAEDSEDIVQETFVKAFKALPALDLNRPVKPWLYKIAVNSTVSHLRKNNGKHHVEWSDVEAPPSRDWSETIPEKLDAQAALERLPIDYRRVIVLRAVEDLSFAEIAEILDIPEATARIRFHRARRMFANLI